MLYSMFEIVARCAEDDAGNVRIDVVAGNCVSYVVLQVLCCLGAVIAELDSEALDDRGHPLHTVVHLEFLVRATAFTREIRCKQLRILPLGVKLRVTMAVRRQRCGPTVPLRVLRAGEGSDGAIKTILT